ncbi:gamma-glutamyltransferase 2. Threonine peptidase. MEROPS family T03 [Roseovarius lutimaris]|uniref:Gamma-glutamyltransferase 2. Threonine peptidase. MEROPS family T03 n=1 Tax=Roseovarius lutimaris TaxID=1005928 RepID=A0A1I4ZGF5_9RHOB|nr:gamma-glutamyltransferase family protein [Roseovarius lutimaris]SFN49354.1 gamma-glutamyltransferase 2. Threonine peptidase. MEROPS family T03 [Roseovarius lutimaris]
MTFTTRPEITGTFGVATSTHWIASAVGMSILEKGGNAFDAAVAMGFTLHVVEPHLNGPLGDMPALIRPAGADQPTMICGQGTAPAAATIEHYKSEGLEMIPGSGLLATVIPGAFGAWMLMLRDHGSMRLRDVLEPAIHYAREGHPMLARVAATIADLGAYFQEEWPSSFATWLPGGVAPKAGELFCNPDLADTWDRLLAEAEAKDSRESQIDAARDAFYSGFIAERIDSYLRDACVMDAAGGRRKGVLTGEDMAGWRASYEAPLSFEYHGWNVWKGGAWTQGPTLLQSLMTLSGLDIAAMDLNGAEFVHTVTEAMKLGFADREAYYGDPDHTEIPMETLLSERYASTRRALISGTASREQRPGIVPGYESWVEAAIARGNMDVVAGPGVGAGEPTMAHLTEKRGDTVHIDVIDRWGNSVAATPSGGWLQSSPVIPGLGMPLNSRAQMFWLREGLATSLAPGRRPRTTLSPSMAQAPDGTELAFGTPGGDQQDQWQLIYFLRLVHGGLNLQEGIDAPLFNTAHFQSSFYPRGTQPGHLMVEPNFGESVIADLRARGHDVEVAEPWTVGRLTAASRDPRGILRAAATPRLMQAYAAGR